MESRYVCGRVDTGTLSYVMEDIHREMFSSSDRTGMNSV